MKIQKGRKHHNKGLIQKIRRQTSKLQNLVDIMRQKHFRKSPLLHNEIATQNTNQSSGVKFGSKRPRAVFWYTFLVNIPNTMLPTMMTSTSIVTGSLLRKCRTLNQCSIFHLMRTNPQDTKNKFFHKTVFYSLKRREREVSAIQILLQVSTIVM